MMPRPRKLPTYRHYRVLFEVGSLSGLSDGELLARFVRREEQSAELAFTALVERHASKVLRICRAVVGNEHDAEDAFQATFLVLASKAAKLRARESLGPWLLAVARRVAAGARARDLGRVSRERRAASDRGRRSEPEAVSDDISSVLHEEIDRLPERYRLPLLLCDLESQSHQEAAKRLGWPLGTVKSRQARGRQRLRARLTRRGLSGSLGIIGVSCAAPSASAFVPESLIESTAQTAADFISGGTAGRAVSVSVLSLVTKTLRAMMMIKLSTVMGVLLTVGAGLAATVLAQEKPKPATPRYDSAPANSASVSFTPYTAEIASRAPVFEYEIRIWKDGAPVTPTLKIRAVPGETSQLKIAEGTLDVRFQPKTDDSGSAANQAPSGKPENDAAALSRSRMAQDLYRNLTTLRSPSDSKTLAEELDRRATLDVIGQADAQSQKQLADLVAIISAKQAAPVAKDHEQRLLEIERKLEKILSVLDRSTPKKPKSPGDPQTK
jgi:RNA polymerase sigma factor (sigma-70 family)